MPSKCTPKNRSNHKHSHQIQTIQPNNLKILPVFCSMSIFPSSCMKNNLWLFLICFCTSLKNMPKLGEVTEYKEMVIAGFHYSNLPLRLINEPFQDQKCTFSPGFCLNVLVVHIDVFQLQLLFWVTSPLGSCDTPADSVEKFCGVALEFASGLPAILLWLVDASSTVIFWKEVESMSELCTSLDDEPDSDASRPLVDIHFVQSLRLLTLSSCGNHNDNQTKLIKMSIASQVARFNQRKKCLGQAIP